MRRMVGRRIVETGGHDVAWKVTVLRRWGWTDEFYSEREIGVQVSDAGSLTITTDGKIRSCNPRHWKMVTSIRVASRARV